MAKSNPAYIDEYEVLKVLGHGGMGKVYLCLDPDLQRPVAIKLLRMGKAEKGREARRLRFLREALTTAQLQHPAIPPVYSVRETKAGQIYYVMKPIEGRPLAEILTSLRQDTTKDKETFDLFRLVEILHDVSQALQYAHSKGYLHRDLKPSNIFVGDYGEVYVIDWGLTKMLRSDADAGASASQPQGLGKAAPPIPDVMSHDSTVTQTVHAPQLSIGDDSTVDVRSTLTLAGDILGTLAYMPPEQATGRLDVLGPESDIYALGVILYEILTHELPVEGDGFAEIVEAKRNGDIVPPELRSPGRELPPELSAIAMQAMSPAPGGRFKSAGEFTKSLEFWLEGKSQFRNAFSGSVNPQDVLFLPKSGKRSWSIQKETVVTRVHRGKTNAYLLFARECSGDVRFSTHVIAMPRHDDPGAISQIALVLNAATPQAGPWPGFLDCYSVHLGASNNTRAYLSKNDTEVVSNEYVALEPQKRYRLTVERTQNHIRVMLDRQVILFLEDRSPPAGLRVGFLHRGEGIHFSNTRIQARGLPAMTASINVPEALMEEGCFAAAEKHFMAIAQGHKNRLEGAWALYRAGIARYRRKQDRRAALRVWSSLRRGPYAIFEQLGRAVLELERNRHLRAARLLGKLVASDTNIPHLDPIADIVFEQAQQRLRQSPRGERTWGIIDTWSRLAVILGQRVESKRAMAPSILWRWLLLALTSYPHHLSECLHFLRETFGKGQGRFADILTTIDPLMTILRRSASMADHAYLMDKVMRLILSYDDNLGNLETLARFYLHAGHEDVALRISQHVYKLCDKHEFAIPPMPITYLACLEWLRGDADEDCTLLHAMIERSSDWAKADGELLLGLEHFSRGHHEEARALWRHVAQDNNAQSYNRHLVAGGLLGDLPPDPEAAGVPSRSDHRLLYCLFVGYRFYLTWIATKDAEAKDTAVRLLQAARALIRPSYDVYSATDTFSRIPLERMGHPPPPRPDPEPLTPEEEAWLRDLAQAAAKETATEQRNPSSHPRRTPRAGKRRRTSSKRGKGTRRRS